MAFDLGEDEAYGVIITINGMLKRAYNIGEHENWTKQHNEWWGAPRESLGGKTAEESLAANPDGVIDLAIEFLLEKERKTWAPSNT